MVNSNNKKLRIQLINNMHISSQNDGQILWLKAMHLEYIMAVSDDCLLLKKLFSSKFR